MSEADANEADVVEQLQPVSGGEPGPVQGDAALPLEAEPADVLEQGHALPDDDGDEDHARPQDAEEDRA